MTKKKLEKAKARRKDYEKRRNIYKRNEPVENSLNVRLSAGDGRLPESKKNRPCKHRKLVK